MQTLKMSENQMLFFHFIKNLSHFLHDSKKVMLRNVQAHRDLFFCGCWIAKKKKKSFLEFLSFILPHIYFQPVSGIQQPIGFRWDQLLLELLLWEWTPLSVSWTPKVCMSHWGLLRNISTVLNWWDFLSWMPNTRLCWVVSCKSRMCILHNVINRKYSGGQRNGGWSHPVHRTSDAERHNFTINICWCPAAVSRGSSIWDECARS